MAAHYGSISIVTFVAATSVLASQGIAAEGYMVAVAAVMEAPAILSALWLVARGGRTGGVDGRRVVARNPAERVDRAAGRGVPDRLGHRARTGWRKSSAFIVAPFKGVLCLFLLDMGLVAGRGLRDSRGVVGAGAIAFGVVMPPLGGRHRPGLGAGHRACPPAAWRC